MAGTAQTRDVLDLLPIAVVLVEEDSIWMNLAAERITGYSRDDLQTVERYLGKLCAPTAREEATASARSPFSPGATRPEAYLLRCGNGEQRWIEHHTQPSGLGNICTLRDVPDAVREDMADRKRQQLLERVSRLADVGGWEVDLVTNEYYWSEQIYRLYGIDPRLGIDEAVVMQAYSPEVRALLIATSQRSTASGVPYELEVPAHTPARGQIWVRIRGEVESRDGRPIRAVGTIQDITEQHRMDEAIREARSKAEAASLAKSEFLANMSHEIRTPMNGVIGMTQLLLETPLDATQRDYAETVGNSAQALLTVINDILDFSKIEAGKLELECIDIDLRDTVQEAARLLAIQAHAKHLELTLDIDADVPARVSGDSGRLRQILLNLGGNAVKFTQRGEIAIDLRVLGAEAGRTTVRIEVRDTGIGIPETRLSKLFKPFSQVDSSMTRQFGGTGLGLSIVRRLVELMGGESGVESREGIGSRFWFTATFGAASARDVSEPSMPAGLKGLRVLVVDDNATNRRVVSAQLQQCGCTAVSATCAQEALHLLRRAAHGAAHFDVALLDHQMPDGDGADLGQQIIADAALKSTRLILLTSLGQAGDHRFFAELGFAGYLMKPVKLHDLIDSLHVAAASRAEVWHTQTQPIVTAEALGQLRLRKNRRILVAEDNIVNQKVVRRLLETMGFKVEIADNGRAAVEAWAQSEFDLILMDCQMPELDGYEATAEIRRRENRGQRIPILALTAHAIKGSDAASKAAGMDDHLTKPIDRKSLQAALERFLPASFEGTARVLRSASQ